MSATVIEIAVAAVCRTARPEYIGGTEDADQGASVAVRDPNGVRYRTKWPRRSCRTCWPADRCRRCCRAL